jgi:DNA end-binding protein Ku
MPSSRAYWSGHLRVSLVSFAIRLYPAYNAARQIAFHQIDRKSGQRVRQQLVVADSGPIDRADIVKGYEYKKDHYVEIDPEELNALKLPSKHTIDIVQFVRSDEIDVIYYDRPYYILPEDDLALPAFATVRDAMRATRTTGLGEIVFSGREHLGAIRPCGKGLVLETLRYADEVRRAAPYFEEIKDIAVDADQLDLARTLIERKTAPLDMSKFTDSYESAVKELVDAKLHDRPLPKDEDEPPRGNIVNLMDALKKSIAAGQQAAAKPATEPKPAEAKPAEAKPKGQTRAAPKRASRSKS